MKSTQDFLGNVKTEVNASAERTRACARAAKQAKQEKHIAESKVRMRLVRREHEAAVQKEKERQELARKEFAEIMKAKKQVANQEGLAAKKWEKEYAARSRATLAFKEFHVKDTEFGLTRKIWPVSAPRRVRGVMPSPAQMDVRV